MAGDPCAALFGSLKDDCEKARAGVSNTVSSGSSIWDFLTNPQSVVGGIRHIFVRLAEVTVGGLLIIVGVNALIKAQTNVNVMGSAKSAAKGIVK